MKSEEVPPIPKPIKSEDLEAFLNMLGPPTKVYFDLIFADTSTLDGKVRNILPSFKGQLMPPDIKYQAWEIQEPGAESGENYIANLVTAHRRYEQIQQIAFEEGTDETLTMDKNGLRLKKLRWEIDRDMTIEMIACPQK